MAARRVVLKAGKEAAVVGGHPWIFSGAIASGLPHPVPDDQRRQGLSRHNNLEENGIGGEVLKVYSSRGNFVAQAYFNPRASGIVGRVVSYHEDVDPLDAIAQNIDAAIALRRLKCFGFDPSMPSSSSSAVAAGRRGTEPGSDGGQLITDAYRVLNSEGDFVPGLIVDRYRDTLVVQINTLGMRRMKACVLRMLEDRLQPQHVYEKSVGPARREEGLEDECGWLRGGTKLVDGRIAAIEDVEVLEDGICYSVPIVHGQKTGFFLDHRDMRALVRSMANKRHVLNCFSYTGAFSISALAGGALSTTSVDISADAIAKSKHNTHLNGFVVDKQDYIVEDVFQYLRRPAKEFERYSLAILDPPAFAKKKADVIQACRGYKDINRQLLSKMPVNSFVLTSSCSHFVDRELFQKVIWQAAVEAKRRVRIIDRHHQAWDHPLNICHLEGDYLKSLFLHVE